jgi:adiponectin receptor
LEADEDLSLDSSVSLAYSTLQDVRTRCSQVSDEAIGAGRRKVHAMVETLEARYQDALAAADSMTEKAKMGIEILDGMLSDFESNAYKLKESGLARATDAAGHIMDESRRVVDEGFELASEVVNEGINRAKHAAESLEEHVQWAIARAKEHGLLTYEDLPAPWRVNPHILKGYRFNDSKTGLVRSVFGVHNELVNIWSHALGLVLILAVAFYFYPTSINFSQSTKADMVIAGVFFIAAAQCLVCSTIWHTMNAVADVKLVSTFACVDYTGISLLIGASIITTEYTAFYCDPTSRWVYMAATALLGVGGVILPWHPKFNGPDMAWARVAFYCGLALSGGLPILQLSITHGAAFIWEFYSPILKSLSVYFLGAMIYATKVPERWFPGMFDYCGGSHNLWHIAVLGGILFHYNAMQAFFATAYRLAPDGCPAN